VESEERIVVGVNRYVEKEETAAVEIDRPDPTVRVEQAARLRDLRGRRDGAAVQKALDQIRRTAAGRDNVLPELIQAVRNLATVGEMAAALGDVFGEHRETVVF